DPFCCRICCDVDPDEVSAVQSNDDEGIEQIEADGRYDEQIHGGDLQHVIAQEGAPSLTWRSTPLGYAFGDARLRHVKPELEQFAMDAWRAPQRVLNTHLPDQCPQLRLNLRPPSRRARFPTPVVAKASAMPPNKCFGANDGGNRQDRWKRAISWMKTKRSPLVTRTRPVTFRRSTIS